MFRSLWIHKILGISRSRNARRRQKPQLRPPVRLHLESLEDRITPSSAPITLTAGDATQLQNDLATANANPTQPYIIQLTASSYTLTSPLKIANTAGVTIEPPPDGATLNGILFGLGGSLTPNSDLVPNHVVSGAGLVEGGGVYVSGGGSLTLQNTTMPNDTAQGADGVIVSPIGGGSAPGGGVYVSGGGVVSISAADGTE